MTGLVALNCGDGGCVKVTGAADNPQCLFSPAKSADSQFIAREFSPFSRTLSLQSGVKD